MRSAPFRPAVAALLVFGGCYSASRDPAPQLPAVAPSGTAASETPAQSAPRATVASELERSERGSSREGRAPASRPEAVATPTVPPPTDAPVAAADPAPTSPSKATTKDHFFADASIEGDLVRPDADSRSARRGKGEGEAAGGRSAPKADPAGGAPSPETEAFFGLLGGEATGNPGTGNGIGAGNAGGTGSAGLGVGAGHGSGPALAPPARPAQSAVASEPDNDPGDRGGEAYTDHGVNPFTETARDPFSTFAVDVDTASYSIARRKILSGEAPPAASVRVEEFVNYFHYDYPAPRSGPFAVHLDAAPSPFTPGRHLLRVGLQGKRVSNDQRTPAHLTFLVDVSGSMNRPDRLPLAKQALRILVENLRASDTVALVTYAGNVRVVLPPTSAASRATILSAIEELRSGGGTAMGSGIELAYRQAAKGLDGRSSSRVIILSDGDANIGATSHERILQTIRGHVSEGVTVTTVGFGMGNYKDTMMEQLADKGNGNAFYVDSVAQARRIFQQDLAGTLEVIAKDVKIQVELDPEQVLRYRLIGYENRDVADRDFRNDRVDAGEIGAGHSVTALYEVELAPNAGGQLARVHVRAKAPRGERAEEQSFAFGAERLYPSFESAPPDFRFATAVMAAAEKLRGSAQAAGWDFEAIRKIASGATPPGNAERAEFVALLGRASPVVARIAAR